MAADQPSRLRAKRRTLGNVTVCCGCCGAVERQRPEVPVDWLKEQWKARCLRAVLQLTISRCLGPCNLANVVRVSGCDFDIWLGQSSTREQYERLVEWAVVCASAATIVVLPPAFDSMRFDAFVPTARTE